MDTRVINLKAEQFKAIRDGAPFDIQRKLFEVEEGDLIIYQVHGGKDPNHMIKRQVDRIVPPELLGETDYKLLLLRKTPEELTESKLLNLLVWLIISIVIIGGVFYLLYQDS